MRRRTDTWKGERLEQNQESYNATDEEEDVDIEETLTVLEENMKTMEEGLRLA